MNVQTLINRIQAHLERPPGLHKIVDSINIAISRINALIEPLDSYLTIANSASGNWEDITTTWENLDDNWEDIGKFSDWFKYNTTDFSLTSNSNRITRIKNVYKNGLALKIVSKESIDLSIYTENAVAIIGRTIYFPADIDSGTDIYKIKCKLVFSNIAYSSAEISDASSNTIEYNIPAYFDDLIYNIVISILSRDNNQVSMARQYIKSELEISGIKTDIWSNK